MQQYANQKCGTDTIPFEVISETAKTKTVREMKCSPNKAPKVLGVGGFSCVTDNSSQQVLPQ